MSNVNNTNQTEARMAAKSSAVLSLLFGALCWGIIWFPYRLLAEAGISAVVSSFYTYGIVIILAGIYFAKHWRGILTLPISIVWLSIVAGWTNLAYVLAVIDGEVMRVMLLFYLSPLWTLILAHFWLKERTNFRGLMIISLSLLGAFIMLYDFSGQTGALPLPRNSAEWIALSSGMGFSLTNVITRKSTHLTVLTKSFAVWLGVFVVAILFMPFVKGAIPAPSSFSVNNWLVMLLIAILVMAATLLVQYGVTLITATRASVLFLFELVVAAVASYYLAHEVMTWNEWLGGGLIVAAAIFAASNHND
jgi:drug/metabolite transporter (DMT)-like permease